jgi:hypothetical protein
MRLFHFLFPFIQHDWFIVVVFRIRVVAAAAQLNKSASIDRRASVPSIVSSATKPFQLCTF